MVDGEEDVIEPVPSGMDFFGFAKSYKQLDGLNAPDKDNITSLVISRNGLYAMRVDDPQGIIDFYNNMAADNRMLDAFKRQ